jgi:hypothetical protein
LLRSRSCRDPRSPREPRRDDERPSRGVGARRCRLAGSPARAPRRRVTRQPPSAGALDGSPRRQFDDAGVRRVVRGVRRLRHVGNLHAPPLVRRPVGFP